uniref:Uncharacterized protein n=1 Tax=Anguilla anguilla TaxID=7936 RepID=A0A0E9UNX9_ANGAN
MHNTADTIPVIRVKYRSWVLVPCHVHSNIKHCWISYRGNIVIQFVFHLKGGKFETIR